MRHLNTHKIYLKDLRNKAFAGGPNKEEFELYSLQDHSWISHRKKEEAKKQNFIGKRRKFHLCAIS